MYSLSKPAKPWLHGCPTKAGVVIAEVTGAIQLPAEVAEASSAQIDQLVEQTIRADELDLLARAIVARHDSGTDPAAVEQVFSHITGVPDGGY